jgi:hypothetical protein
MHGGIWIIPVSLGMLHAVIVLYLLYTHVALWLLY